MADDFLDGGGVFVGGSPIPPIVPAMDLDLGEGYRPSDFIYGRDYSALGIGTNYWQKINDILSPISVNYKVSIGALTTAYDELLYINGRVYPTDGVRFGSAATITQDGGGNLVFSDGISGSVTLAVLLAAGSGNVMSTGTPVNGQIAQWTDDHTIQGISVSSLTLSQSQITDLVTDLAGKASLTHALIDTVHHTVSGLTTGTFLKALSGTTYGFAPHGLTATDIGLGAVTNNAQVRKITSATNNAVVRWDGAGGDLVQDSLMTVADDGTPNIPLGMTYNINGTPHTHAGVFQPVDATLTALAALDTSVGFIYQTGADTFTKYTFSGSGTATSVSRSDHDHGGVYLTGNQTITLSGDATGSGTTSITVTLATVNIDTFGVDTFLKFAVNGKGLIISAAAIVESDINTTFGSKTANFVYASPDGSAGSPTFRALTSGDIPALAESKITNLVTDLSGKQPLDTTLTTLSNLVDSTGSLYNNGSGTLSWATIAGGGNVSSSGTPTSGQLAQWVTATDIQGIAITSLVTDGFGALSDITTNNATISAHGFLPKLNNNASQYLNGTGAWSTPSGGGNVSTSGTITTGTLARWASTTSIESVTNGTANYVFGMHATSGHEWKALLVGSTKLSVAHAAGSITFDVVTANVDHNGLLNYSANRHIDHTGVLISAGTGLTGGGDISATRTLTVTYGTTVGTACVGNDSRLSDARTPINHNLVSSYHPVSGLTTGHFLKATSATTFSFAVHGLTYTDVGAAASSHSQAETTINFTDITTGNASISVHGYLPKLGGGTTNFLRADGTWAVPSGGTNYWQRIGTTLSPATTGDLVQAVTYYIGTNAEGVLNATTNTSFNVNAANGVSGTPNGRVLYLLGGAPYNTAGADAGNVNIRAGAARAGDSASVSGNVYVAPGNPYTSSVVGVVYLGDSAYDGGTIMLTAEGSSVNVNLLIRSKGTSTISIGDGSSNSVAIYGTNTGIYSTTITIGNNGDSTITGTNGNSGSVTGKNATLKGGNAHTVGNNNGGHVYIYGGAGNGTGLRGNVYFGSGAAGYLYGRTSETNVVYYDPTTGKLTYGGLLSGPDNHAYTYALSDVQCTVAVSSLMTSTTTPAGNSMFVIFEAPISVTSNSQTVVLYLYINSVLKLTTRCNIYTNTQFVGFHYLQGSVMNNYQSVEVKWSGSTNIWQYGSSVGPRQLTLIDLP